MKRLGKCGINVMKFKQTELKGAWVIELDFNVDARGYFSRFYCQREFSAHGIEPRVVQGNVSQSRHKGTLRGMHYQKPPAQETKLMCCTHGSVYDVIIDLRVDSPTYLDHIGVYMDARDKRMLFVPRGFAHGFLTLEEDTEMLYLVSEYFSPRHAAGIRYDDPLIDINWPSEVSVLSDQDASWPYLESDQ